MSLSGNPGWNDIIINGLAVATKPTDNPPDLETFKGNQELYAFDGAGGSEQVWTAAHILHDYKLGTDVYPHVHWSHNQVAPSGDVVWQLEYMVAKGFGLEVFPAPIILTMQQTADVQYTHQIIESLTAIPASDIEPDTVVLMRLFRDSAHANDTFANDAFLIQLDLHYESDGLLTHEKQRPFTKRMR